ncbi:MAG: hypothetical protein AABY79_07425 [Nitrospirota bacterium]|jgi:hypothetical protein
MGNKRLKKKIESLKKQIMQHEDKIRKERIKNFPDEGMIRHWEVEIASFRKGIEKIMRRLNK